MFAAVTMVAALTPTNANVQLSAIAGEALATGIALAARLCRVHGVTHLPLEVHGRLVRREIHRMEAATRWIPAVTAIVAVLPGRTCTVLWNVTTWAITNTCTSLELYFVS